MSKRVHALIRGIVDGAAIIAQAVVVFAAPPYAVAIVAAIGIAASAINEITELFISDK